MWRNASRCTVAAVTVLVLLPVVTAFGVDLGVSGTVTAELLVVDQQQTGAQRTWTVSVKNTGSRPFTGRLRLDITQGNSTMFRTWSQPLQLEPGSAGDHRLAFAAPNLSGPVQADIVLSYGDNREERVHRTVNSTAAATDDGIRVPVVRTYQDHVRLGIRAPADVDTLTVAIDGWSTRRFAQVHVDDPGQHTYVDVPYYPTIPGREEATVTVFDGQGRYFEQTKVQLHRMQGFGAMVWGAVDALVAPLLSAVALV